MFQGLNAVIGHMVLGVPFKLNEKGEKQNKVSIPVPEFADENLSVSF